MTTGVLCREKKKEDMRQRKQGAMDAPDKTRARLGQLEGEGEGVVSVWPILK